jgi:hypothetical protein
MAVAFSHIEVEGHMGNEPVSAGAFTNIFRINAIFIGIYGLGFFLAPKVLFSMSQDPGFPADPGWVRWAGGTLIGLAVGAWIASNDPAKQRPLVIALAIGNGLLAVSQLYSILFGVYQGGCLVCLDARDPCRRTCFGDALAAQQV